MYADDFDAFAHDTYENHMYEKIRAEYPHATPVEVAMRVIGALNLGE
ncbi:hypothetical protein SO3561_06285 [Streptomyces olivochromogenes]|uniref:Uncharacterized protein n=1 Tax=Streptomyces olivochromogenes TaxID=1963 RepID=A0A250VL05_STROL|nr:hypothetical protein SO3561_06285 [Streptomyces olivochromogenes]